MHSIMLCDETSRFKEICRTKYRVARFSFPPIRAYIFQYINHVPPCLIEFLQGDAPFSCK
jgi:hypothetical protein